MLIKVENNCSAAADYYVEVNGTDQFRAREVAYEFVYGKAHRRSEWHEHDETAYALLVEEYTEVIQIAKIINL